MQSIDYNNRLLQVARYIRVEILLFDRVTKVVLLTNVPRPNKEKSMSINLGHFLNTLTANFLIVESNV